MYSPEEAIAAECSFLLCIKRCNHVTVGTCGRKQTKRLRMDKTSPYDHYFPPTDHLPAGFTSFPTEFPSPTSILALAASTPYYAHWQPQPGHQQAAASPNGAQYIRHLELHLSYNAVSLASVATCTRGISISPTSDASPDNH